MVPQMYQKSGPGHKSRGVAKAELRTRTSKFLRADGQVMGPKLARGPVVRNKACVGTLLLNRATVAESCAGRRYRVVCGAEVSATGL